MSTIVDTIRNAGGLIAQVATLEANHVGADERLSNLEQSVSKMAKAGDHAKFLEGLFLPFENANKLAIVAAALQSFENALKELAGLPARIEAIEKQFEAWTPLLTALEHKVNLVAIPPTVDPDAPDEETLIEQEVQKRLDAAVQVRVQQLVQGLVNPVVVSIPTMT